MDPQFYGVFEDRSLSNPEPLADVPIEHATIGGMGLARGRIITDGGWVFKPYVYKGTGEDQFPETPEPAPKPKPKAVTVDEAKARVREVARIKYRAREARRKKAVWQREQIRRSRVTTVRTLLDPPDPRYDRLVYVEVGEDDPPPPPSLDWRGRPRPPARPSPGWRPTTGDSIAALLEELDD